MKNRKTLLLDAIRNIWNRKVAFLSIVTIMMLGVGGLLCILNLQTSMQYKGNEFYSEHNFEDFEVVASLGISEEDLELIKEVDGVKDAEGVYRTEADLVEGEKKLHVNVLTESERINTTSLQTGEMPKESNECAVNKQVLDAFGYSVGDEIKIINSGVSGLFEETTYKITGMIMHPKYIGLKEYCVLLPDAAIDKESVQGQYLVAYVKADLPGETDVFSKSYAKKLDTVRKNMEAFTVSHSGNRTEQLKEEASEQYEEKKTEAEEGLKEAEEQIEDGEQKLKEGLKEAQDKIDTAQKDLEDGKIKLQQELANAEVKINTSQAEATTQLEEAWNKIVAGKETAAREFADAKSQLEDGNEKWDEAKAKLEEAEKTLREKLSDDDPDLPALIVFMETAMDKLAEQTEDMEKDYPELVGNKGWEDLKALLSERHELIENFRKGTPEERENILIDFERRTNEIYENLPREGKFMEEIQSFMDGVKKYAPETYENMEKVINGLKELGDGKNALEEGRRRLDEGWSEYWAKKAEVDEELAEADRQYEQAKAEAERKIAAAWAEYNKTKAEKEKEILDAQIQINEAQEEYEKNKVEREEELEEAKEEFKEKRQEIRTQLTEAKEKIDNLDDYNYIVNPRGLTTSFALYNDSVNTCSTFALIFIPLFGTVAGLVVFSTIAILVDEQKHQIGAVKALGLYNREAAFKFIVFSAGGTFLGNVFGFILGKLLLLPVAKAILASYEFGDFKLKTAVVSLTVLMVGTMVLSVVIAVFACNGLLKCSAIGLINGSEPVRRTMKGNKKKGHGTLYSRLILNNLRMDAARVLVSIAVITGSCVLIGFGFTVRHSFQTTTTIQTKQINAYTIQVVFDDNTMQYYDQVKKFTEDNGGLYLECRYTEGLITMNEGNEGFILVSADSKDLDDFIHVRDLKEKQVPFPKGKILVPIKTAERLKGSTLVSVYDKKLYRREAPIGGQFVYYLGCLGVSDKETYEEIYQTEYTPNCLYLKLDSLGESGAMAGILGISDQLKILKPNYLVEKGDNVNKLFDIITVICIGLSVLLTFMILINFTTILVNRRMKEMLVMRVNGFTLKETIGYVARESAAITVLGLLVGVGFGVLISRIAVTCMETEHAMYLRSPYALAWVFAIAFTVVFTVIIDLISFRKIGKVPLTDVSKY